MQAEARQENARLQYTLIAGGGFDKVKRELCGV